MIEGVLASLIASAIGAVIIYLVGKLLHDWYYVDICLPNKKGKKGNEVKTNTEDINDGDDKKKERGIIKIFRKFPWRHAYRYAKKAVDTMRDGQAEELYKPTIIVCIGRGGAIYGSIISYFMGETPMLGLDRRYYYDEQNNRVEDWCHPIEIPKELLRRVLLVAGEYHSGKTMSRFKQRLTEIGAEEIRSCVFYYQTDLAEQIGTPDYFGISGKRDCIMPWQEKNYLRTWKSPDDAKKREYKLNEQYPENLKDGFFLMRHASTNANKEDRFIGSGSPNENISPEGRIDARSVGRFLKETVGKLDIIYCSPVPRCLQTAQEIHKLVGGEIVTDLRLTEADFGDWENKLRQELPSQEYAQYINNQNYTIPGSKDTYSKIQERASSFLNELANNNTLHHKSVLVVTHKTIGRIMVQHIEGKELQHFRTIPMENASLRRVMLKDGTMSVAYYVKVLDGDVVAN